METRVWEQDASNRPSESRCPATARPRGPRGRLTLEVRHDGALVAERRTTNIVLRQGASLIAKLFAGATGSSAINRVRLGFGTDGASVEATSLTPGPDGVPQTALESSIPPDAFTFVTDGPEYVSVRIVTTIQPTMELANVTEAGLLGGDTLYNQVVFEPITLRVGQDVSLFWQIDFPFGH
jgi:hypothetical protein